MNMFVPEDLRSWIADWRGKLGEKIHIARCRDDLYAELERQHAGNRSNHMVPSYESLVECVALIDKRHGELS